MFCTTECWNCDDKSCKYYISKSNLYFKNKELEERIDKAIKYIKKDSWHYAYEDDYDIYLCESELEELLEILKGSDNNVSKK